MAGLALWQPNGGGHSDKRPPTTAESPTNGVTPPRVTSPTSGGWMPLLNGQNLDGWTVLPKSGNWSMQQGVLVGRGRNSYILTNRDDFADFELRVECRINAAGNSGVFFRCDSNDWLPVGFEANIELSNLGRLHDTRSQPNKKIPNPTNVGTLSPGQWFTYEIQARGTKIVMKIDGRTVLDFTSDEPIPMRGHLGLQCYEPDTTIEVRRFDVRTLP